MNGAGRWAATAGAAVATAAGNGWGTLPPVKGHPAAAAAAAACGGGDRTPATAWPTRAADNACRVIGTAVVDGGSPATAAACARGGCWGC